MIFSAIAPNVVKSYSHVQVKKAINGSRHIHDVKSSPLTAFDIAYRFFDLGSDSRLDALLFLRKKDSREITRVANIVKSLLQHGIVGYEYLEVNGMPYKSYVTTRIGDQALSSRRRYPRYRTPFSHLI